MDTIWVSQAQMAFDSGAYPLVLGPSSWGFGIFPVVNNLWGGPFNPPGFGTINVKLVDPYREGWSW